MALALWRLVQEVGDLQQFSLGYKARPCTTTTETTENIERKKKRVLA